MQLPELRQACDQLLQYTPEEREFLERFFHKGEIWAELLTKDPEIQFNIENHPGLLHRRNKRAEKRAAQEAEYL